MREAGERGREREERERDWNVAARNLGVFVCVIIDTLVLHTKGGK